MVGPGSSAQIRPPAVAGRFYPGQAAQLQRELASHLRVVGAAEPAIAMVGPHAGWMYSGAILGETYARVRVPEHVVLLCPNHTGRGVRRSLWAGGAWALPGDEVPIDTGLADRVAERAGLERDREAHLHEHAIEVHLPFVRRCNPDARVVPIVLAGLNVDECRELGLGLAAAVRESRARGEAVLLVASTDMSHYVTAETARRLDTLALERVLALDPAGLHATVRRHQISMCGFVPTTCVLFAALELGATRAELVRYGHSGETSGDLQRVVGYAGLVLR